MKNKLDKICLVLSIVILAVMLNFILGAFLGQCLAGDEAVFIRITDRLPDYSSRAEWFTREGDIHPDDCDYLPTTPFFRSAYDKLIWHHPPLANYLAYPAVKLIWSDESIETIDSGTEKLRWIAWAMLTFCIVGTIYIINKKFKSGKVLLLSMLPLIAGYTIFTHWGQNWFYHDMFMLIFLIIALLMKGTKCEKFIYIPLTLMVGCKLTAIFLLLPFIIRNKKTALCSLILIPYYIQCGIVTGDWLYHWTVIVRGAGARQSVPWDRWNTSTWMLVVTAIPFMYTAYNAIRKRASWFYPTLFLVVCLLGLGWTHCLYQMLPMMIGGMLLMGEAVNQFIAQRKRSNA